MGLWRPSPPFLSPKRPDLGLLLVGMDALYGMASKRVVKYTLESDPWQQVGHPLQASKGRVQ